MSKLKKNLKIAWRIWTGICVLAFTLMISVILYISDFQSIYPDEEEAKECFRLEGFLDDNGECVEYDYDIKFRECMNMDGDWIYGEGCRLPEQKNEAVPQQN